MMMKYEVTHDGFDPVFVDAPTRKAAICEAWKKHKAKGSRISYGAFTMSAKAVPYFRAPKVGEEFRTRPEHGSDDGADR